MIGRTMFILCALGAILTFVVWQAGEDAIYAAALDQTSLTVTRTHEIPIRDFDRRRDGQGYPRESGLSFGPFELRLAQAVKTYPMRGGGETDRLNRVHSMRVPVWLPMVLLAVYPTVVAVRHRRDLLSVVERPMIVVIVLAFCGTGIAGIASLRSTYEGIVGSGNLTLRRTFDIPRSAYTGPLDRVAGAHAYKLGTDGPHARRMISRALIIFSCKQVALLEAHEEVAETYEIHQWIIGQPRFLPVLASLLAVYPAISLVGVFFRHRHRRRHNLCPNCGYPREGLPSPTCPECGRKFG